MPPALVLSPTTTTRTRLRSRSSPEAPRRRRLEELRLVVSVVPRPARPRTDATPVVEELPDKLAAAALGTLLEREVSNRTALEVALRADASATGTGTRSSAQGTRVSTLDPTGNNSRRSSSRAWRNSVSTSTPMSPRPCALLSSLLVERSFAHLSLELAAQLLARFPLRVRPRLRPSQHEEREASPGRRPPPIQPLDLGRPRHSRPRREGPRASLRHGQHHLDAHGRRSLRLPLGHCSHARGRQALHGQARGRTSRYVDAPFWLSRSGTRPLTCFLHRLPFGQRERGRPSPRERQGHAQLALGSLARGDLHQPKLCVPSRPRRSFCSRRPRPPQPLLLARRDRTARLVRVPLPQIRSFAHGRRGRWNCRPYRGRCVRQGWLFARARLVRHDQDAERV